jgi:hypothetical protein
MYHVALLIERQLENLDADQIVSLHEGLDETVHYHLLLPVESSTAILTSSMSALGGGQVAAMPDPATVDEMHEEIVKAGQAELDASAALLTDRNQQATGQLTEADPIDTLKDLIATTGSSEVIILTESHIVKEFFQIDWTSRAKRALDVPTLHLLEHVPFDAQH